MALCLLSHLNSLAQFSSKNVLVFKGINQETITTAPILDGFVIKFDEDSVFLKMSDWHSAFVKSQLEEIDHVECFRSDLSVTVLTNEILNIPLEDKLVTLHNEYDDEIYGNIKKTTQLGESIFKDVPTGFYSLYITDPDNVFESFSLNHFLHGLSSSKELIVKEKVISPEDINYELIDQGDDLYDALIKWATNQYMAGYSYLIYLNDELIGETTSDCYILTSLSPGEYEVAIVGKSEYGNIASEGRQLLVLIEDRESGIPSFESESLIPAYFDMQGRIITDPTPGIYIHNGKKVIIP